ncbi:SIS domain-containing protein [Aureobasidium pullulans]|uniref:SIS domain-containing protein n=1 Tax=Aureobasidium pullulans TaxID=5580 RepID=A0AB74J2G7_AURPU|nr:SIS domain-containing protein [Aureobasidium pullulans]
MHTSSSPRPCKRQRMTITPPSTIHDPESMSILDRATRVLSIEATALSHVTRLYQTDPHAREGLLGAVECITKSQAEGGKVIVCGVGKSGLVGRKTVATLKSLSIAASFMHAAEAAHGDLGDIREHDVLFFISYSGKTPELINLLPHLPRKLQIVALTSQSKASECPLLKEYENGVLLPAPLFELEEVSFGVSAPTTSTTVQIAIGDMLALTVADQLHENKGKTFKKNHPGGAIGAVTKASAEAIADAYQQPITTLDIVPLELPSPSISAQSDS